MKRRGVIMKDKPSIEIETSYAPMPRPYIVNIASKTYRTYDKQTMTIYIIKYSDGSICQLVSKNGAIEIVEEKGKK